MNAPLARLATDLAPIDEVFFARCEARALLHVNGYLSLHDAVDDLQSYAERSGLVDIIGQDDAQAIMSAAFAHVETVPDEITDELSEACERAIMLRAADLVKQGELDDLRDRWRHTGEAPPVPEIAPAAEKPYRTPRATVDAFWYMARQDDVAEMDAWLADHPKDAAFLLKLLEGRRNA
jgi:hypothetical protein